MFQRKCTAIALLCLAVFLLWGCREQEADPIITESQVWETMPQLTYGVLEYERLQAADWNSGRSEATSRYWFAETEAGYYWKHGLTLYYADRSDLSLWIPVCSDPSCSRAPGSSTCQALIFRNTFFVRDGRIWFASGTDLYPELYSGKNHAPALFSRAANGTDTRLEFVLEEAAELPGNTVSYSMVLTPAHFLYGQINMDQQGGYHGICCRAAEEGVEVLFDGETESDSVIMRLWPYGGDTSFGCSLLEETSTDMCFIESGQLIIRNTSDYMKAGRYLSGNILRCFLENQGYFDVDLDTGEAALVARNQLRGSGAMILLPNCIIESTLDYYAEDPNSEVTAHAMKLFNGENWHDVQLPEELKNANAFSYAVPVAVTSDWIFFRVSIDSRSPQIYCIPLDGEELSPKYCGTFAV